MHLRPKRIIILALFGVFAIYNYQNSRDYLLNGSYQAEVFNKNEEEVGIYTINFEEEEVTLFSAAFNESYTGIVNDSSNTNEYELQFDEFEIQCIVISKDEIQLSIEDQEYIFEKK